MTTVKKYMSVPTITFDYKVHAQYLKDNSEKQLYLRFENDNSYIVLLNILQMNMQIYHMIIRYIDVLMLILHHLI